MIGYKTTTGCVVLEKVKKSNTYKLRCVCGNIFNSRRHNFTKKTSLIYCRKCTPKYRKKKKTDFEGQKLGRWTVLFESDNRTKNGNILYECVCNCGTLRLVNSNVLSMGESLSCGCLQKEIISKLSRQRCGSTHPSWKGGKLLWKKKIVLRKCGEKSQKLRHYVYKRDKYKCCICESTEKINAHHLDGWNWCINGRYNETNLITLCKSCHFSFHKKYGRGNNTLEQFLEFSNNIGFDLEFYLIRFNEYKIMNGGTPCLA